MGSSFSKWRQDRVFGPFFFVLSFLAKATFDFVRNRSNPWRDCLVMPSTKSFKRRAKVHLFFSHPLLFFFPFSLLLSLSLSLSIYASNRQTTINSSSALCFSLLQTSPLTHSQLASFAHFPPSPIVLTPLFSRHLSSSTMADSQNLSPCKVNFNGALRRFLISRPAVWSDFEHKV